MSKRATFPLGKAASKKLMSSGATASRGQDFLATLQRGHDVFGGVMRLDVVEVQGGAVVRGEEVPPHADPWSNMSHGLVADSVHSCQETPRASSWWKRLSTL